MMNDEELQAMNNEMVAQIKSLEERNHVLKRDNELKENVIIELQHKTAFLEGQIEAYQYVVASRR